MIEPDDILDIELTKDAQEEVSTFLFTWLSEKIRKAPVQDLEARMEKMRRNLDVMVRGIKLSYKDSRVVVSVTGDGEPTLRQLKNGSTWFDPFPNVDEMIAIAALSS